MKYNFKKFLTHLLGIYLFLNYSLAQGKEIKLSDLRLQETESLTRNVASESPTHAKKTTQYLAITTLSLLAATALTAKEKEASSTHVSLAGLSFLSYGAFLNSYLTSNIENSDEQQYKWASYSKWIHIPAMLILPISGAIAQRQFNKGENSASGFGSLHKPAALAAVVGMALTTFSLTFEF